MQAHPRTEPERRTLRVVVTTSERDARRAKRALQRGATWRTVTKRYSIDGHARARVRSRAPATRFRRDAGVRGVRGRARAAARPDQDASSATTSSRSIEIVPEHPTPLTTQRARRGRSSPSEAQQQALAAFDQAFTAKWRARTTCAADLAAHRDCGNPPTGEYRQPRPNPKARAENSYIRRTSASPVARVSGAPYGRSRPTFARGLGCPVRDVRGVDD